MLVGLKCLHDIGFCHWDLKLDNICYKEGYYYLIDFALAQRVQPSSSDKRKYGFKGNSMFASMRKLDMSEPAYPIDDIESLLYLVCFCYDEFYLPWLQDYYKNTNNMHQFIHLRKKNADLHMKYLSNTMPPQISKAMKYINKLNIKHTKYQLKYEKVYSQLEPSP